MGSISKYLPLNLERMVNSCQHRQAPVNNKYDNNNYLNKKTDYQLVKGLPHGYNTGLVSRKVDAKKWMLTA